jgi:succinate-semialdehyde dehydrogenase/glutarate-semialdehyde dehydrogenase
MAGNVGILKHASNVPQSALAIAEVFARAGFPEGCFQALLVGSAAVGRMIDDPRIAAVTLTGSEGAGVAVGRAAGAQIKRRCSSSAAAIRSSSSPPPTSPRPPRPR